MEDEKRESAKESLATSADSRIKKIIKYSIALGLVWFIVHSWFIIPRRYISVGSHTSACTHSKYAWVMDAFAPNEPRVPRGRLAENFFLYDFRLSATTTLTSHIQHHTELGQCNRSVSQIRDEAPPCWFGRGLTHCQVLPRSSPTRALHPESH
jgi:hypothetical protein